MPKHTVAALPVSAGPPDYALSELLAVTAALPYLVETYFVRAISLRFVRTSPEGEHGSCSSVLATH